MNYYEILGVGFNAPDEIINNAYFSLLQKYHPYTFTGDRDFAEQKMKEINEAYSVLSDPDLRASYNVTCDEFYRPPNSSNIDSNNQDSYNNYTSGYSYLYNESIADQTQSDNNDYYRTERNPNKDFDDYMEFNNKKKNENNGSLKWFVAVGFILIIGIFVLFQWNKIVQGTDYYFNALQNEQNSIIKQQDTSGNIDSSPVLSSNTNSVVTQQASQKSSIVSSSMQTKPKDTSSAVSSKPKTTSSVPTTSTYSNPNTQMKSFTSISTNDYYGRNQLSGNDQIAYDQIAQAIADCDQVVNFNPEIINQDTFNKIFNYYVADHPEAIQLGKGQFSISTSNSRVVSVNFGQAYLFDEAERDSRIAAINAKLPEILGNIPANATEFDVELKIHDWLVNNCTYDATAPNCYDAYGAIVDGRAVCQGYAEAMQYLLYRAGIQCLFVSGSSQGQPHGWNIVEIDGNYYELDSTWDDPVSDTPFLSHQYFNLTDAEMSVDHTFDPSNYPLPACTSTADNYFVDENLVINTIGDANTILENAMLTAAKTQSTLPIEVRINADQYNTIYGQLIPSEINSYITQIRRAGYIIKSYSFSPKSTEQDPNYIYVFSISLFY